MSVKRENSSVKEKALEIIDVISAKKAKDIVLLDLKNVSALCDYFIICSGDSTRQVRAIYEELRKLAKKNKIKIQHYEEDKESHWILVDLFDIIIHIFFEEARKFYNLEYLWNTAKKIKLPDYIQSSS